MNMKNTSQRYVHFVGICGVTMAPIAKMFKDMGWRVTGSDKGFFPPMSDYLRRNEIEFWPGWHVEKIGIRNKELEIRREKKLLDFAVIGNFIGYNNPEFVFLREQNILYKSYPEILSEYVVKKNSIVVAGTYGKSTISAALAWVLEKAGYNPSYMSGGILKNFSDGVRATDSDWSVVEGDEYSTARWDLRPKFVHYKPKYLILTSTEWDHTDLYKTREDYLNIFRELVANVPKDGVIVYNPETVDERVMETADCDIVKYSQPTEKVFHTHLIGWHNQTNLTAIAVLCRYLRINKDIVQEAIESFEGVRRRLETRYAVGENLHPVQVIDDLAHSPAKVRASLSALREWYPDARIRVIFEPNIGSRTKEALPLYKGVFDKADEVFIPRLSKAKKKEGVEWVSGADLCNFLANFSIQSSNSQILYEPDDHKLVNILVDESKKDDIIAFMGSHGFRGMIEEVIKGLRVNF